MDAILTSKVDKSLEASITIIIASIVTLITVVINENFVYAPVSVVLLTVWVCIAIICIFTIRKLDVNNSAHIEFVRNEILITITVFHNDNYTTRIYHSKYMDITSIFEDKETGVVTISGTFDCFDIALAGTKEISDLLVGIRSGCDRQLSMKLVPINSNSISKYIADNSPLCVVSK